MVKLKCNLNIWGEKVNLLYFTTEKLQGAYLNPHFRTIERGFCKTLENQFVARKRTVS